MEWNSIDLDSTLIAGADQEGKREMEHMQDTANNNGSQLILDGEDEHKHQEPEVENDEDYPLIIIAPQAIFDDSREGEDDNNVANMEFGSSNTELDHNYDEGEALVRNQVAALGHNDELYLAVEFRDNIGNLIQCLGSEINGSIICPICHVECISKRNIMRHYNNIHADPKLYTCTICSETLTRKDTLARHLKKRHRVVEQGGILVDIPYTCNACASSFSCPDALAAHSCTAVTGPTAVCTQPQDDKEAAPPPRTSLKRVAPSSSIPPIPQDDLKCPLCSKEFSMRQQLLRHVKSHMEDHQCHDCGKNYSREDKLQEHVRKQHGIDLRSTRSRRNKGEHVVVEQTVKDEAFH